MQRGLLFTYLLNATLIGGWLLLTLVSLWRLRHQQEQTKAIWALVIVAIPMLGSIAYLLTSRSD